MFTKPRDDSIDILHPISHHLCVNDASGTKPPRLTAPEILAVALACAVFSYVAAFAHLVMVDSRAANDIDRYHNEVLTGQADSPMQYRPGAYLLAESMRKAFNIDLVRTYYLERMFFYFTTGLLIFAFFRRFLSIGWALAGIGWFYAVLPFTYIGYGHQPADPINATFYAIAYLAAASGMPLWIFPTIALGAFFRETVILLPVINLFVEYGRRPIGGVIVRFMIGIAVALLVIYAIRTLYGPRPHPDEWIMIGTNLEQSGRWIWGLIILAGLPSVLTIWGWRGLDTFHKRSILFAVLFLVIHFVFGRFGETRLYLPILPLFISAAINALKWRLETPRKI